jgi:glucose/arabinose dehydrogenase
MRKLLIFMTVFAAYTAAAQDLRLTTLVGGLDQPTYLTHAGDSRLFITLQRGQIVIWDGTRILPTPFLDITALVSCCGERGLLSVAFPPNYATNGLFFVHYTRTNGDVALARYSVSAANRDRADPTTGVVLLTITHSQFGNHNGGQLQFGPDGYLYMGVGDGGSGGDPNGNGQNTAQLLGKMLRLDVNAATYTIPPSNPFVGRAGARGEIWAYGLRNPWRFSFDRETGDLWIADVGQDRYEEIDFQPRTSIGGENYGWRLTEGKHCFNPPTNCGLGATVLPIIEYSHNDGCSITGGYVYRGTRIPTLRGTYLYADYCSGIIWGATGSPADGFFASVLLTTSKDLTSFGEDVNGELYLLRGGSSGTVLRFDGPPIASRRRAVRH